MTIKQDLELTKTAYEEERKGRIDYLRKEIQEERISTEEILELQSLKDSIPSDDVELLQGAGVEENI